jgi:hypothetical protein
LSLRAEQSPSPSLPALHDALVSAAARRYPPPERARARWVLPVVLASLVTSGAALAAPALFGGRSSNDARVVMVDREQTSARGNPRGVFSTAEAQRLNLACVETRSAMSCR